MVTDRSEHPMTNGPDGTVDARRVRLTRELVVRTALRIMDEEGLEAVTMRRIGRELGVEAMSLYNHVRDKEDLLDGVAQAAMADFRYDPSPDGDWLEQGRAAAREWRSLLKIHPNLMTLLVERKHPLTDASALRPMEVALGILRRAGLSERDTVHAFQATGGYIFGFVMMEIGNVAPGRPGSIEELPGDRGRLGEDFPVFTQLLPWLVECDMDATFEFGLDLLLEGIRAKAASS
jgi:AcrR family transcriptional regulator